MDLLPLTFVYAELWSKRWRMPKKLLGSFGARLTRLWHLTLDSVFVSLWILLLAPAAWTAVWIRYSTLIACLVNNF